LKVVSLVALFGFAGFASNNLGSKRSIAVLAVLTILNFSALQFTGLVSCPSVGWAWMDVKQNTLTNEIIVETYDGGGPGCVNDPWYVEEVSEDR
jgi:hypothetical protein